MRLKTIIFAIALSASLPAFAQKTATDFPELTMATIPGAPVLSKPILITGTGGKIQAEGMGLAAPAFYDWDGDGLKDLLAGEFGSGTEKGRSVGNFIKVFKNEGSSENPEFTGSFDYARPPFEMPGNGTPYSVDQYCCIGFTPQFVDLNGDKKLDMISGQYYGEVSWFEGSDAGFRPGEFVSQEAYLGGPRHEPNGIERKTHQHYWIYSSASFGDFTGDGIPDLITGGIMALRISPNVGTLSDPRFGKREMLLDLEGKPLKVHQLTPEELKPYEELKMLGVLPPITGDGEVSPYVIDWDNDGILDLLVTNTYVNKGLAAVDFFKGIKTKEGHRFHQALPLFTAKSNEKAFPGMGLRVSVADWNSDGVNDLLIGTAVVTINGQFSDSLSWKWQNDTKILPPGKNPPPIVHQGYVYVMLGEDVYPKEGMKTNEVKGNGKKGVKTSRTKSKK